ncbi:MAG: transglutaminase-like domain-containing protein [Lachnospiraceae bacterium]|nr:transglutaminase-like domain-containing protein [Lachnospiraceae bacterium]
MRRFVQLFFLCFIVFMMPTVIVHAENGVGISDNRNGTITVKYANDNKIKIAITVEKSGTNIQYRYFVQDKNVNAVIPMTLGNGNYTVSVLKNIEGTRYSPLDSQEVSLQLKDYKNSYLTSNEMIKWDKKNAAIKKANKIAKKYKGQLNKVKGIYKYLVTNYHYDYNKFAQNSSGNLSYYTPNINTTYKSKKGICYDISALTASMLRSIGVQTKMVTGYPANKYFDGKSYHAWNVLYSKEKKKWIIIDVTCDMCLYEQKTKYKNLTMIKKASHYSNIRYEY